MKRQDTVELIHRNLPAKGKVPFPSLGICLDSMLHCTGSETQGESYGFHGRKRGTREWATLQYTLAGKGRMVYHGKEYALTPGTAMLATFPDDLQYGTAPGEKWDSIYFCLSGSEIMKIWRELIQKSGPVLELPTGCKVINYLVYVFNRMVSGLVDSPFAASGLAYQMGMVLLEHTQSDVPVDVNQHSRRIRLAMDFVEDHIGEPIGVEDMARAAGVSRFYFSRIFTETMKIPPGRYLIEQRLARAVLLLQTTEQTVKSISLASGFCDPSYFTRAFTKHFGLSPKAFRERGLYT